MCLEIRVTIIIIGRIQCSFQKDIFQINVNSIVADYVQPTVSRFLEFECRLWASDRNPLKGYRSVAPPLGNTKHKHRTSANKSVTPVPKQQKAQLSWDRTITVIGISKWPLHLRLAVAYPGICFGGVTPGIVFGGVQEIQLRTERTGICWR
jgi:hypothetical protein